MDNLLIRQETNNEDEELKPIIWARKVDPSSLLSGSTSRAIES